MAIILRTTKGAPLTFRELDSNFSEISVRLDDLEQSVNQTRDVFSGNYLDLTNKPELFSGDYLDLVNTPSIPNNLSDLSNVLGTVPENDQVLKWNGTAWAPANETVNTEATTLNGESAAYYLNYANFVNTPAIPQTIADLLNVSSNRPNVGNVLKWNGTQWEPALDNSSADGTGISLNDLSVTVTELSPISNLEFNNLSGVFTYTPPDLTPYATTASLSLVATSGSYNDLTDTPIIPSDISDLTDVSSLIFSRSYNDLTDTPTIPVDIDELTDNNNLLFSGSYSDLTDTPTLLRTLSDLDDVSATSPVTGQILVWNGATWAPEDNILGSKIGLNDLTVRVNPPTVNSNGSLEYDNTTGEFSYTQPDLSPFAISSTLSFVAVTGSYTDLSNTPENLSEFANDVGYLTTETTTSLSLNANILTYTDEQGTATDLDLSLYLDDTNLARLVSGSLNTSTGLVTFTRDDGTTFDIDFSPLLNITLADISVGPNSPASDSGALDYNNTTGVFTYTPPDLTPYATTSILSSVATSGSYNDLTNTPTIPSDLSDLTDTTSLLFDRAYSSLTGAPTVVSAFTNDVGYLTTETTTSLSLDANILTYTDEQGTATDLDLSLYLDDTNLARLVSGSLNASTGIATFTRDDATTFDIDFSALLNVTLADLDAETGLTPSGNGSLTYNNTTGMFTYTPPDLTPYATTVSLASVATSGAYADLSGTPTIPSDLSELTDTTSLLFSGSYNDLSDTPTIPGDVSELTDTTSLLFSGAYADLSGTPTIPASILDLNIVDGTAGQVLTTDGAGDFSFTTISSSGTMASRTTVSGTTASLADGATGNVDITGFRAYSLMAIQTSGAAWIRVYANAASRTADAGRLETVDPAPDAGVIAEVITTGAETVLISPGVIGFNFESPVTNTIPIAVTNKTGGTTTITTTLTVLQMEA